MFCTHGHVDHIGATVAHARARALTNAAATYYMPESCIEPILAVKAAFEALDEREIPMVIRAMAPGDSFPITSSLRVQAFPTQHRVRSQGYAVFSSARSRTLREEFRHMDRLELKAVIAAQADVYTASSEALQLCYTGDTVMSGLLHPESLFVFSAPLLIMELTYLDGDAAKSVQWGHVHIDDVLHNASLFRNDQVLFVHLSQKYQPYSRAIRMLQSKLPPPLLSRAAVSLFSFGSGEHVTVLNRSFDREKSEAGWGWAHSRSHSSDSHGKQRHSHGGS